MSYIKINEVDKTISDLSPITSDNIVYIPINSSDGPSGVYNVLQSYTDFVDMYGIDPNPNSAVMTSWDYAANLLLRNMPVMVRRITHFLDNDGNDTTSNDEVTRHDYTTGTDVTYKGGLLPGAARAKGLLKVDNYESTSDTTAGSIVKNVPLTTAGNVDHTLVLNKTNIIEAICSNTTSTYSISCKTSDQVDTPITTTGSIESSADMPVTKYIEISFALEQKISVLNVCGGSDSEVHENITRFRNGRDVVNSPDVTFIKSDGSILPKDQIVITSASSDDLLADATIPQGTILRYTLSEENVSKYITYEVALQFEPTEANLLTIRYVENSNNYTIITIGTEDKISSTVVYKYKTESVDNPSATDSTGKLNLLKVAYKNIGSNGSRISVGIKNIENDGLYLQTWNSTQRLESIQLVNYRHKTQNNYYATYNIEKDYEIIWKQFLSNFGISLPVADQAAATNLMVTNYVAVQLNPNLDWSDASKYKEYLAAIAKQNGKTVYKLSGGSSPSDDDVKHEIKYSYKPLKDKYLYDVKFISNGGYVDERKTQTGNTYEIPSAEFRYITDAQIDLAESRGDCLAFVDIPMAVSREEALDYFQHLSTSYATCYAPWVRLNLLTRETKWCPPSFAALWTIAKSVGRGNKIYAPPAGVNRANIPECADLAYQIPAEYIDSWQDNYTQFINPIIYINGYGVNIFGQKTLYSRVDGSYDTKSALQFLNTRLVCNEVKKRIFKSCIELTFEYNNLHTWLAFKSKMSTLLDTLLYDQAITYYDIQMDENTMSTADIQANHIVGIVSIACSTTAEKFDITFELLPNQVNFLNIDYSVDNTTDAYGSQG